MNTEDISLYSSFGHQPKMQTRMSIFFVHMILQDKHLDTEKFLFIE